jgi:hypothetical protein
MLKYSVSYHFVWEYQLTITNSSRIIVSGPLHLLINLISSYPIDQWQVQLSWSDATFLTCGDPGRTKFDNVLVS